MGDGDGAGPLGMTRREFTRWLSVMAAASTTSAYSCGPSRREKPGRTGKQAPPARPAPDAPRPSGPVYDVVVVGAGLSGLTAGHLLKGEKILVLEKEARAGGRIKSTRLGGFHISLGAAYLGKPDAEMKAWFKELGVKAVPVPPPTDAFGHGSKIYAGGDFYRLLKAEKACQDWARAGKELRALNGQGVEEAVYQRHDRLKRFARLDQASVRDWLQKRKFHPFVQGIIDVENRGLFGASNRDISLLFDVPEMAFNIHDPEASEACDASDMVLAALQDDTSELYTFPRGLGEAVWAIERQLGRRLRTGAEVTRVTVDKDRKATTVYKKGGKEHAVRSWAVVLATPAPVTAKIVTSGLSPAVMSALRSVRYGSYVTMALLLSARVWRGAWNLCCLDTCFTTLNDAIRLQVAADYTSKGVLGVALPPKTLAGSEALLQQSDDQLAAQVLKDVARYFPGIRGQIQDKRVNRFRHAFPVFGPGYLSTLSTFRGDRTTRGPLLLAGDYTIYPTLGGAAASGVQVVRQVTKYAKTR